MRARVNTNPLQRLYGKQKLGQEAADECALVMLLSIDAAKRGRATGRISNNLALYLLTAVSIWHRTGKTGLYQEAATAWEQFSKACARPTQLLDLTTGEYKAIRAALAHFIDALPMIELATFTEALGLAASTLGEVATA